MFENLSININQRIRSLPCAQIQIQFYVAGRRVNVLLASSGCAPHCTRRPAPGVLLLEFRARKDFHASPIIWN
jgi:hypothetical protein